MKTKGIVTTVIAGVATLAVYNYLIKPFLDKQTSSTTAGEA